MAARKKAKAKELARIDAETFNHLHRVVESIGTAVDDIRSSGVGEDALLTLLQNACAPVQVHGRRDAKKPTKAIIAAVLQGMEALDTYVFPPDED